MSSSDKPKKKPVYRDSTVRIVNQLCALMSEYKLTHLSVGPDGRIEISKSLESPPVEHKETMNQAERRASELNVLRDSNAYKFFSAGIPRR